MKYIFSLVLYTCLAFAGTSLKFKSAGNDTATIEFRLEGSKEFVIVGTFLNNADPEEAPAKALESFEFKGTYREGLNTYDLTFKNVDKKEIEELIKGSSDLWLIPSNGNVRMNKNPKDLRFYKIKMDAQKP
ncbi:MAG: hypothetical protein A4S09_07130 [Proteobacteria bacterium SG_bin7]|nr:MAG: hypothetical protein A4S09_07130 [Proteobacteria bacterium SG_bin7]